MIKFFKIFFCEHVRTEYTNMEQWIEYEAIIHIKYKKCLDCGKMIKEIKSEPLTEFLYGI